MKTLELSEHFEDSIASFPSKEILFVPDISLEQFLALDYRISDARLLSQDSKMRGIVGESFSQSTYGGYILGLAAIPELNVGFAGNRQVVDDHELIEIYFKNAKKDLLEFLNKSTVSGVRGNRSAIVGSVFTVSDEDGEDEYQVIPFAISTTVFYNDFRATIGFGNKDEQFENIKKDIESKNVIFSKFALIKPQDSNELSSFCCVGESLANDLREEENSAQLQSTPPSNW